MWKMGQLTQETVKVMGGGEDPIKKTANQICLSWQRLRFPMYCIVLVLEHGVHLDLLDSWVNTEEHVYDQNHLNMYVNVYKVRVD